MTAHTWDIETNCCVHCGATPEAINAGWRAVDCNPGTNLIGFTHRIKKKLWAAGSLLPVERFPPPESA
jgi:hypothetical protein